MGAFLMRQTRPSATLCTGALPPAGLGTLMMHRRQLEEVLEHMKRIMVGMLSFEDWQRRCGAPLLARSCCRTLFGEPAEPFCRALTSPAPAPGPTSTGFSGSLRCTHL